jgi:hypothetical protein
VKSGPISSLTNLGKMKKEIVLLIEDSAYEKFMGMLSLCPQVEVVSEAMDGVSDFDVDYCMACAIRELCHYGVFSFSCDYAYIMAALNEEVVKDVPFFYTPMDFLSYLKSLGFENIPGKTSIYDTINKIKGSFPNWTFTDHPKDIEVRRRINVVKRFLNAFGKAKRGMSERMSE